MNNAPGAAGGRFWLLIGDVPNGPFDVAQIHAKLLSGTITWQTRACPLGGNTWLPLVGTPGFGPTPLGEVPSMIPVLPNSMNDSRRRGTAESAVAAQEPVQDEPPRQYRLSAFGNLICVYCLAINPFLWVASNLTCCVAGSSYKEDSALAGYDFFHSLSDAVVGLGITAALAWGGERLRRRGLAEKGLLRVALSLSITWSLVSLLASIILVVAAAVSDGDHFAETSDAQTVITFFMCLIALGAFTFEIASLIWLVRSDPSYQMETPQQSRVTRLLKSSAGLAVWGAITTFLVSVSFAPWGRDVLKADPKNVHGYGTVLLLIVKAAAWLGPAPTAAIGLGLFGLVAFGQINELTSPQLVSGSQDQQRST